MPDPLAPAAQSRIVATLAAELDARPPQVEAACALLDGGATVPFIARYRKEATGGLDDVRLRRLEERLGSLRELEARRATVLDGIAAQGLLDQALRERIEAADTRQRLEDLYAPYRPKRRTRAQLAREAGLEPLAEALLADPGRDPAATAAAFVDAAAGFGDARAALDGARDILAERFAEDAELVGRLRDFVWSRGLVRAARVEGQPDEGARFRDYYAHAEPLRSIPSHRALALFRGRQAGVLELKLALPDELEAAQPHPCVAKVAAAADIAPAGRAADGWLAEVCRWTWRVKLQPALETESFARVREAAEAEAIRVFGRNLKDLLLAPPAGAKVTMGLDPGLRTGVKVAVVDGASRVVATATVYPHPPRNDREGAIAQLAALAERHAVALVAIGNGTASRETDALVAELIRRHPALGLARVTVSEAGASVYSASELASAELPELDVSLRGAVSIARRLQDPLAELVKIDPRSIGVGQYQHDVPPGPLGRALDAVVEDCVNAVGVDVNTASPALLARVSGLGPALARAVVAWREREGPFATRADLRQVPRFGDRSFEQAAGFLRIAGGANPLDRSAVHPEAYPVVERILAAAGQPIEAVMGNRELLRAFDPARFTDERFGVPTVRDILAELEKPGRDPRPQFRCVRFREGVEKPSDLEPGMLLDGVVTNVANFGAFVDIGVHQDGLVHVSALADRYVRDPREVVKAGDQVKVRVVEVDLQRGRIALTMRLAEPGGAAPAGSGAASSGAERGRRPRAAAGDAAARPPATTAIARAFARAKPRG